MLSSEPLRRPRRGEHARASRSARWLPAVLLLVPAGSLAGLRMSHDTSPAHLAHLALAARSTADEPVPPTPAGGASLLGRGAAVPDLGPASADRPTPVRAAPPTSRASRSRPVPTWTLPADGRMSSRFGPRWGSFHPGIDIAAPTGDPISAAAAGVVTSAGWGGGYGNVVRVQNADGVTTVYAHMSQILVAAGQPVAVGEPIGKIGSTGFSTGPHLHFEVRVQDQAIDPLPWLHGHGVTYYGSATTPTNSGAPAAHAED